MAILFNMLLDGADIDPADVRLLRHKDGRAAPGRTPYDLWRDDRPAFERYQSVQSGKRALFQSPLWAIFVGTPAGETLFVGLRRVRYLGRNVETITWPHADGVDPPGTVDTYELQDDARMAEFEGRVVIDWGPGERAWVQKAANRNKPVLELRRTFREPEFPGFMKFREPLSRIAGLPPGWRAVLKAARGVYLLTCPKTREQYVGSASGADGFYGRWMSYFHGGHGGNVGLKSRDPSDYQVSILEVVGSAAAHADILAMEALWKDKLQSREMGLNRN